MNCRTTEAKRIVRQSRGKKLSYWALVESYRTARGPRHRVVWLALQLWEKLGLDRRLEELLPAGQEET
jgi:hypothetical protein